VKIVSSGKTVKLFVAAPHTPDDHSEDKNKLKFLTPRQKKLIHDAVRIAPHQTATDLIRNVQESPTKQIHHRLKHSVARQIRKERKQMNKITLGGIELDDSLGTLRQDTDVFWFGKALEEHRAGNCLDMFQPYIIGRQFDADDRLVIMSVSTPFDLLNIMRALATGFQVLFI
jgi:hypothetical protein